MDKGHKKGVRTALGRGLSALISTPPVSLVPAKPQESAPAATPINSNLALKAPAEIAPVSSENPPVRYIKIDSIINNPGQPRQEFKNEELTELADSIKQLGVLQPVLVRPVTDGKYEIVAGERRWRASTIAGLKQVPAIVHEIDDREALQIALVENVQRSNLNPVEEARAYQKLADEFALSQQEIAERVGKDRASIANYMRLLKLPDEVLGYLKETKISMGHAKAILSIKEPAAQLSLARKCISENLSVRSLESIVARVVVLDGGKLRKKDVEQKGASRQSQFPEVVDRMRNTLGTKVSIKHHTGGRGRIEIEYFSENELDRIIEVICR